jgi:glycosyltransferase involved in cell wall biosynthesis
VRLVYVCGDKGVPVLGGKGASVHARSITSALARRGHRVTLACVTPGTGNPIPPGVRMVRVPRNPRQQASLIAHLIVTEQADGVVERYNLESGPARYASAQLGLPLILEVNAPLVLEAAIYRGLTGVDTWLRREREILSSADAIGAVSKALVDYVDERVAGAVPCRWIPNGVDVAPFRTATPASLGVPPGSVVVGFVGSMKRWHGVADLIEAVRRLGSSRPVHLVIAGSGPESDEIGQQVRSSGIEDRVHLLGQLAHRDVPSVLRAFDIGAAPYTQASDFYFSPLKVLEYLAAGLPVVCPDMGDLPRLAGDAGVYYTPGSVDSLTEGLRTLIERPSFRRSAASAAGRLAERWSWDANASAYEALIDAARQPDVVGMGGGRP